MYTAGDALLSTSFEHVAAYTPKSVPAERVVEVLRRLGAAVGAYGESCVSESHLISCRFDDYHRPISLIDRSSRWTSDGSRVRE